MTVVELVGAARAELGLFPISTTVVSSSQEIDLQMLSLLNQLGRELQQRTTWTALQTEHIVTTNVVHNTTGDTVANSAVITNIADIGDVAANSWVVMGPNLITSSRVLSVDSATQVTMSERATATQVGVALQFSQDTYAIPSDFGSFISDTWWDRTNRWMLLGPTSPQYDQFLRSGIVTTTPRRNWREIGRLPTAWRVWPPPGTTDPRLTMVYEYNSLNWATASNGTTLSTVTQDTDTTVFPDALVVAGIKLKYFQSKGFDTGNLRETYERLYATALANDGGAAKLNMGRRTPQPYLLNYWNIPDSGYGPR